MDTIKKNQKITDRATTQEIELVLGPDSFLDNALVNHFMWIGLKLNPDGSLEPLKNDKRMENIILEEITLKS